jgi:hypothetical protein
MSVGQEIGVLDEQRMSHRQFLEHGQRLRPVKL